MRGLCPACLIVLLLPAAGLVGAEPNAEVRLASWVVPESLSVATSDLSPRDPGWEPGQAFLHDLGRKTGGVLGSWNCWTLVADPRARRDDPLVGGWRTDDSWKLSVAGPLFVFGTLEGGSEGLGGAEMNLIGKTGVGCKVPVALGASVQVRGGPTVVYSDPLASQPVQERSELFIEVLAKCPLPLPGGVGLEYLSTTLPAMGALQSQRVNQELRLAIPVGDSGLLRVGAKHLSDDATPRSWRDGMQVFLGLEVKPGVGRK